MPVKTGLKINDVVSAQIVEVVASNEYIVALDGDLIRVKNSTHHNFNLNEHVLLRVTAVAPLTFQLASGTRNFEWHV